MAKVIILENLDFEWELKDIDKVINLWNEGKSLMDISKEVKRNTNETFLLLMHLSIKGTIKKRPGYLYVSKVKQ